MSRIKDTLGGEERMTSTKSSKILNNGKRMLTLIELKF